VGHLIIRALALCVCLAASTSVRSQTMSVNGLTIDLFLSGQPADSTVLYFPGCNGLDDFGRKYQNFHVSKMQAAWGGRVNIIRLQAVNDVTQGRPNGLCFWSAQEMERLGVSSSRFAQSAGRLASEWIRRQPWFNGHLHFFGFSYGGRVSLMANFIAQTRGQFRSVTGIWPTCRKDQPMKAGTPHTPTRLYSTEGDPISEIGNCRTFYPDGVGEWIQVITYPGDRHSWMTHPEVKGLRVWWPNAGVWTTGEYIPEYAEKTWTGWTRWARCLEVSSVPSDCREE
jgi:dienelactone hydrolase